MKADGAQETLAIPAHIRSEVDERDAGICRFCGRFVGEARALHHIRFGGDEVGMGGRRIHLVENLLTVGWMFDHDCHSILHSNKNLWLPFALEAAVTPGVTVLKLHRWSRVGFDRKKLERIRNGEVG